MLLFLKRSKTFTKRWETCGTSSHFSYSASLLLSTAGKKGVQAAAVVHRAKLSWFFSGLLWGGFLNGSACQAEAGSTAELSIVNLHE